MCNECNRLAFVRNRDGTATDFAKQIVSQYRKAVLTSRKRGYAKPSHASLPEYRRGFIESYLVAKRYRENPDSGEVIQNFVKAQHPLGKDFEKVLNDNLWELLES